MGEAKRKAEAAAANGGGGAGTDEATVTLDEMIRRARPVDYTRMPICPLPLVTFRPALITAVTGEKSGVPALPCLGPQCIMYTESIVPSEDGQGFRRRPQCGFGGAAFTLSQNIAPTLAALGPTLAKALAEALAAREEHLAETIARVVVEAIDEVFPEDEEEETAQQQQQPSSLGEIAGAGLKKE